MQRDRPDGTGSAGARARDGRSRRCAGAAQRRSGGHDLAAQRHARRLAGHADQLSRRAGERDLGRLRGRLAQRCAQRQAALLRERCRRELPAGTRLHPRRARHSRRPWSARAGTPQRVGTSFYDRAAGLIPAAGRAHAAAGEGGDESGLRLAAEACSHRRCKCHDDRRPAAAPGDIFLTPNSGRGQNGAMIIDGSGRLVWFQPAGARQLDDRTCSVSSYAGKPVLAYWQGHIDLGVGFGSDRLLGADYQPVASMHAGNGYYADLHELQLTPQGSAYLSAYTLVRADLSSVRRVDGRRAAGRSRAADRHADRAGDVRVARLRSRRG